MTDASERERLVKALRTSNVPSIDDQYLASDMLRADAETEKECDMWRSIARMRDEEIIAQSAELERVSKLLEEMTAFEPGDDELDKLPDSLVLNLSSARVGPYAVKLRHRRNKKASDAILARTNAEKGCQRLEAELKAALAAPSAAGGEKEG